MKRKRTMNRAHIDMDREDKTRLAAILAHLFTILPAFAFCWEFGVFAILFWLAFDSLYYLLTK